MTFQEIITKADNAGFEFYGSFAEGELQHEILTCTKGRYNGEVLDIYYDYKKGDVHVVEVTSQFKGQEPKFKI